jgi:hypothetical protein
MVYFKSRDIAAIAICASMWGVLNSIFSPIFFNMFGLPFLCDLIGFTVLTITVWWTRKLGSATMVGAIATIINFIFSPGAVHFLGFTAASVVFDVASWLIGYDNVFKKTVNIAISMMLVSTLSAGMAGFLIGTFFMVAPALIKWGGVLVWAGLHAVGGIIGGIIGLVLVSALISRGIQTQNKNQSSGRNVNAL